MINTKFAVIETGGKQYLVKPDSKIRIEKIEKPKRGKTIVFDKVLLINTEEGFKLGTPYIGGAKIKGEWLGEKKGKKITILRYHPKTRYQRKKGHQQIYSEVAIGDI